MIRFTAPTRRTWSLGAPPRRPYRAPVASAEAPPEPEPEPEPSTLLTGLVSYWALDELNAADVRLDSHGPNDLSPVSDPAASTDPQLGARALISDDDPSYVRCLSPVGLQGGDRSFALAGWVWLASNLGEQVIAGRWDFGANDRDYLLEWGDSNTLSWIVRQADNAANVVASLSWGTYHTWTWVCVWHDADLDLIGLQVNAGAPATTTLVGGTHAATSCPFDLGANSAAGGLHWDGALDEWGFWARTLTSDERAALYNGGAGLAYPFA